MMGWGCGITSFIFWGLWGKAGLFFFSWDYDRCWCCVDVDYKGRFRQAESIYWAFQGDEKCSRQEGTEQDAFCFFWELHWLGLKEERGAGSNSLEPRWQNEEGGRRERNGI
jgi:hypothetical protein